MIGPQTLHISHGASGDWFIVQPLEGETQTSMAGTPITHEMAVQHLRDAGRTVYEINAEPWRPSLRWWIRTYRDNLWGADDRKRIRAKRHTKLT